MKHTSFIIALIFLALPSISCAILGGMLRSAKRTDNLQNSNLNTNASPSSPTITTAKLDIEGLKTKAKEISDNPTPLKLNRNAKVESKILMIDKSESDTVEIKGFSYAGDDYSQPDLDEFNLKKEDLATKEEDIKTVILKTCNKGKLIGQYSLSDGRKIPAYAIDCKVSIIDYRIPAIVAQKKFSSRNLSETISASKYTTEWTAAQPYTDISDYIKKFPRQ